MLLSTQLYPEQISRFSAVIVAALRAKQLLRGSKPRIDADPKKRKNTSIAMEEVRRGLITFTPRIKDPATPEDSGPTVAVATPVAGLRADIFSSFKTDERP
jgi:DNA-directed RNA polymerase omega subunit